MHSEQTTRRRLGSSGTGMSVRGRPIRYLSAFAPQESPAAWVGAGGGATCTGGGVGAVVTGGAASVFGAGGGAGCGPPPQAESVSAAATVAQIRPLCAIRPSLLAANRTLLRP